MRVSVCGLLMIVIQGNFVCAIHSHHEVRSNAPVIYRQGALNVIEEDNKKHQYKEKIVYRMFRGQWVKIKHQGWWRSQIQSILKMYSTNDMKTFEEFFDRLEMKEVSQSDKRVCLRGQRTVYAKSDIAAGEILGIYAGVFCENEEEKLWGDERREIDFLEKKHVQNFKKEDYNLYAIEVGPQLTLSGFDRSNIMSLINCAYGKNLRNKDRAKENVEYLALKIGNGFPVVAISTKRGIKASEEILVDYGKNYWKKPQENDQKRNLKKDDKEQKYSAEAWVENLFSFSEIAEKRPKRTKNVIIYEPPIKKAKLSV